MLAIFSCGRRESNSWDTSYGMLYRSHSLTAASYFCLFLELKLVLEVIVLDTEIFL